MRKSLAIAAVALMGMAAAAQGAAPAKEDLRGCKLPHGEGVIPVSGTFEAANGEFLKLSDGSLVASASTWQTKKADAVDEMRNQRTADLAFTPDDGGTLWAISGRIVDVGTTYLYEAAAMKLDRPEVIPGAGKGPVGMIKGVQEGRTFLVEGTDGHFALVRVLEVSKVGVNVEYVYQPSGGTQFDVRKEDLLDVTPVAALREATKIKSLASTSAVVVVPAVAPGPVAVSPAPAPVTAPGVTKTGASGTGLSSGEPRKPVVLAPPFSYHMQQRELMIEMRMKIVTEEAKTPKDIDRKVDAIDELQKMHADEAADEFVRQVAFVNPRGMGKEFQDSVHPCFAALKKMGKAGSDAAIKGLREMDLTAAETEGLESPTYRAGLLALVIRSVEGDDVGQFILRRERDATKDEKRRQMYEQLINPAAKAAN